APYGGRATGWLRENGASAKETAQVIERAERDLRAPPDGRQPHAVSVRLEVLDGAAQGGSAASGGQTREQETLTRWQSNAARDRRRERRQSWAREAARAEHSPRTPVNPGGSARRSPRAGR